MPTPEINTQYAGAKLNITIDRFPAWWTHKITLAETSLDLKLWGDAAGKYMYSTVGKIC